MANHSISFNPNQISAYCGGRRLAIHRKRNVWRGFNPNQISAYCGGLEPSSEQSRAEYGFNPNQISAYCGGAAPPWRMDPAECFNPNQISAYCGGILTGILIVVVLFTFQSESNLGLLWGEPAPVAESAAEKERFNPNQISAYCGGSG